MSMGSKQEARASLLYNVSYESANRQEYAVSSQFASHSPYASGGYYQREGLQPPTPTESDKVSWLYIPHSKWQWLYLGIVVIQAIVGLVLESYTFARFASSLAGFGDHTSQAHSITSYLSLFIFGFVYQVILTYDALRLKNTIQVIGLCIYNIGLLIEAAVQLDQIRDAVYTLEASNEIDHEVWGEIKPLIAAVPGVIAVGLLLMSFTAWKLYGEFAWSIYKNISADLRLKRRFLCYQIYIALLKFDFFFFLAFTVQFLVVVGGTSDAERWITVAAIPVTIVLLFLAAFWVRRETIAGMLLILVVYFAALAYFLFKLVRIYNSSPNRVQDYKPARNSLTTFAVITVLLLIVTIIFAITCTYNFNKGLKPHLMSQRSHRRRAASQDLGKMYNHDLAVAGPSGPSRMTID